ncbi:hypothetical protein ACFY7H_13300 [Streptomyces sp. NPDC012794]|uniref:hypothetical protein n=1 Tax=Streptomyces sp. NPDC012794 TaxID=3364850 RepID=UPI00368FC5F4
MNNIMPDTVVDLIESHYPDRIREAAKLTRKTHWRLLVPESIEDRERSISTLHAAAKVLATYPLATEVAR